MSPAPHRLARPLSLVSILVLAACETQVDPREIATSFWDAARQGQVERAAELVSATSVAAVSDPGTEGSGITHLTLGAADVRGDVATVETRLTNTWAGLTREIVFDTRLVRELGRWRVDLDGTADAIVQSMTPPKWLGRRSVPPPAAGDTIMARDTAGARY